MTTEPELAEVPTTVENNDTPKNSFHNLEARQIAHDIRSPLSALNIVAQKMIAPEDRHYQVLAKAIERINSLANQLLKPKSDELQSSSIRAVYKTIRDVVDEKELEWNRTARLDGDDSNDMRKVPLGSANLFRVLSNLLNNAFEASRPTDEVAVRAYVEGQNLILVVEDTGQGIPAQVLPHLGEAGFTFGKEVGHGLGLYAAKTLIMRAGGRLEIRSRVGHGTSVKIVLPLLR